MGSVARVMARLALELGGREVTLYFIPNYLK